MKELVLTIGGFDPTSGAGVTADIKTFGIHQVYALAVITAIVIQNTTGVVEVEPLKPELVEKQLLNLKEDFSIKAVKVSVVYQKEIARLIKKILEGVPIFVFDPIIKAKNGFSLMKKEDLDEIVTLLFPISTLITPNLEEAKILSGDKVEDVPEMKKAAQRLKEYGPDYVLVKGGHLKGEVKEDVLFDGARFFSFESKKICIDSSVHGTGCAFSSAIVANLVKGCDMISSIKEAKKFIDLAISNSFKPGRGYRLINHFYGERIC